MFPRAKERLAALLRWSAVHAEGLAASAAFVSIAVGFGLAWLPLGFIVPGGIVFTALAWRRIRGG